MTGYYRFIDHTADFGLEIYGADPAALFTSAGRALFDQISGQRESRGEHVRSLDIVGEDWTDLMVNWLRELLFMFNGEHRIVCHISITTLTRTRLRAMVRYDDYVFGQHEIGQEIKAVTYHQAEVGPYASGWRAKIIFDV